MPLLITISGSAGTGKTTHSKLISEKYNLKHVSAGLIFRQFAKENKLTLEELSKKTLIDNSIDLQIDKRIVEIAKKGNIVVEGRLTAWMLKDMNAFKIYLRAPIDIEIERIAARDRKTLDEAKIETLAREKSEKRRFKKIYNIDITDLSIYDIVLNTHLYSIESVSEILFKALDEYIKTKN